jgi:hypothetical protein
MKERRIRIIYYLNSNRYKNIEICRRERPTTLEHWSIEEENDELSNLSSY